ncbi:MAG: nuclear transport factor 2 family protein [Thermodesulfobacteriota bacterium]|jgi:steroid delta-isomerase-like uncharacterized protein
MNLAWAKEWMGNFTATGMEKALGMYADDVQFEDVTFAHKCNGIAELRKFFGGFTAPGAGEHVFTVDSYAGNENGGAVEWTWRAKHASDFLGVPAKGKETTARGVSVLTFKNGKIASQHDYWDANSVIQQLKK